MSAAVDLFSYKPAPRAEERVYDHKGREIPQDVCRLFERFAFDVIGRGFDHYSSDAILHRLRWHAQIEQGDREFKVNDHYSAPLARWFMRRNPRHQIFELRLRKRDQFKAVRTEHE